MNDDVNIIIKGGSVELIFNSDLYPEETGDRKTRSNRARKISRIVIVGDINFDSGEYPDGLRCMVTVFTET